MNPLRAVLLILSDLALLLGLLLWSAYRGMAYLFLSGLGLILFIAGWADYRGGHFSALMAALLGLPAGRGRRRKNLVPLFLSLGLAGYSLIQVLRFGPVDRAQRAAMAGGCFVPFAAKVVAAALLVGAAAVYLAVFPGRRR